MSDVITQFVDAVQPASRFFLQLIKLIPTPVLYLMFLSLGLFVLATIYHLIFR